MNWKKIVGGTVGFVVLFGVFMGMKIQGKINAEKEVKDKLTAICGTDKDCVTVVNTHLGDCFDANYSMGSRRVSASLDSEKFTTCLNQKAGKELFAAKKQ